MIEPLTPADNAALAQLIRQSLEDENLALPGTAYFDPHLDNLAAYYEQVDRSAYWIIKKDNQVIAGVGLAKISDQVCELEKLYVAKAHRGQAYAQRLLDYAFEQAKALGYQQIYLETTKTLTAALKLYEKNGFISLAAPLANGAGHTAMDIWMLKDLN